MEWRRGGGGGHDGHLKMFLTTVLKRLGENQ